MFGATGLPLPATTADSTEFGAKGGRVPVQQARGQVQRADVADAAAASVGVGDTPPVTVSSSRMSVAPESLT